MTSQSKAALSCAAKSAEGQLEREVLSPIEGADYALLSNGSVLHFLTARGVLDLESYVGRRVAVTGVALQGSSLNNPVLAVNTVSAVD